MPLSDALPLQPRLPSLIRTTVWGAVVVLLVTGCGGGGSAEGSATVATVRSTEPLTAVAACSSFAGLTFGNVQVSSSVNVPAAGALPAHCKVNGTELNTAHDIEVRLPLSWRQRYVQQGGGGFDGSIPAIGNTNVALAEGAVLLANNGGHRDPSGAVLFNNPTAVERYAHTAIAIANGFGKALTKRYYGKDPSFSYYQGCSNGGRGALNAAAKYGSEYDAVIAGAPTRNLGGQIEQWTRATKLSVPSNVKLAAISAAAVNKCDMLDGVKDGIVSNWAACQFDATADVPAAVGLTAAEGSSVKSLMSDLKLANGTTIYSGYGTGQLANGAALGVGHMRNIVLNDAAWDPTSFDVDSYYSTILNVIDARYQFNASSSTLATFLASGKKIVVWHGSDDGLLSHKDTLRTWQEVTTQAGDFTKNSKLYIAGGVNHCGGGRGADTFDLLKPTMNWVENGVEPGTISASKVVNQNTQFTRPLCVHPAFARYNGTGDINTASSYTCSIS